MDLTGITGITGIKSISATTGYIAKSPRQKESPYIGKTDLPLSFILKMHATTRTELTTKILTINIEETIQKIALKRINDTLLKETSKTSEEKAKKILDVLDKNPTLSLEKVANEIQKTETGKAVWIEMVKTKVQRIISENKIALDAKDPETQKAVLDKIDLWLKETNAETVTTVARLTIPEPSAPCSIHRVVLLQNLELDLVIVSFLVAGPGSIHNHKPGVIGTGMSLAEDSHGIEYRFVQKNPEAESGSPEEKEVYIVEEIPQSKGLTLRELGNKEVDFIHQISVRPSDTEVHPDIRLHVYQGGRVSETGNPNNRMDFVCVETPIVVTSA